MARPGRTDRPLVKVHEDAGTIPDQVATSVRPAGYQPHHAARLWRRAVKANSGLPSGLRMIYNIKMEVRTSPSSLVPGPQAPRRCSRSAPSFTATRYLGRHVLLARAGNTVAETGPWAVLARAWRARPNCYPINTPSSEFFVPRLTTVALSNTRVVESRTIVQPRCVSHPMGHPRRTHPMGQPRRTQHGQ